MLEQNSAPKTAGCIFRCYHFFSIAVALFIFDKLYIANAGDCRACVYLSGKPQQILQMSHDFSPDADRQRIQELRIFLRLFSNLSF
jgi:serine/threonine protein phosphatase PrpC